MNPFTQLIRAKAAVLKAYFEQSKQIKHSATKGSIREAYIRNFLTEIIPPNSELLGGFITDVAGEMTPQIDLIGIEKSLPIIKLDQGTCVSPIEAARFWVEIKSKIETKHLVQIKERLESIDKMILHLLSENSPLGFQLEFKPPGFVVAYESSAKQETLVEWLSKNKSLYAIIIIGRYALWSIGENNRVEVIENQGKDEELLFLAAKIHQMYILASRMLEMTRRSLGKLDGAPSNEDLQKLNAEDKIDMTHFGLQAYFEASSFSK